MKVPTDLRLTQDIKTLVPRLTDVLTLVCRQLNSLTEGRISSKHSAHSAAPTTGTYTPGDRVPVNPPIAVGDGSYIYEYLCVDDNPLTWRKIKSETT